MLANLRQMYQEGKGATTQGGAARPRFQSLWSTLPLVLKQLTLSSCWIFVDMWGRFLESIDPDGAGGLRVMYAGLAPTLLRAFPANAAQWLTWDLLMRCHPDCGTVRILLLSVIAAQLTTIQH